MSAHTQTKSDRPGVTFCVSAVEMASTAIPSVKTLGAIQRLVGGPIEAACDYTDDCCDDVTTNPFVTAVKLAHDQHRPLVLSPDTIWLTICQQLSMHIEENWSDVAPVVLEAHDNRAQLIDVSTEEFPFGSAENPWDELVSEAAEKAHSYSSAVMKDLFCLSFSTTEKPQRVALDVAFLSAVNNALPIYDRFAICGIPEITLLGTPEDWQAIGGRVSQFELFGMSWWSEKLEPVIDQFVSAARGIVCSDFWSQIYTTGDQICGDGDRVTGWVSTFFPYLQSAREGISKNKGLDGGEPPSIVDFPTGLREVSMRSQRGTVIRMLGGFVGIAQNPETLELQPKIGWAVQRNSSFEELLESISNSELCEVEYENAPYRSNLVMIPSPLLERFYHRFRLVKVTNGNGELLCNFSERRQLGTIREKPNLYQIATLNDGRWIGATAVTDLLGFLKGEAKPMMAFFIGNEESRVAGASCQFVTKDFEVLLQSLVKCAVNGETSFKMDVISEFDPQDRDSALKACQDAD